MSDLSASELDIIRNASAGDMLYLEVGSSGEWYRVRVFDVFGFGVDNGMEYWG